MYVICGMSRWPAIPGPTWPVEASVVSSPHRIMSKSPIFLIVSLSAYAVGTVSDPPRMRSVRRTARSAPIPTPRSRDSSNTVGPIEMTITSAARRSLIWSASSRAFASGGLISLGTPTRFKVCVFGSTWSSWAFGTCLMQTMIRSGRGPMAGVRNPLPSIYFSGSVSGVRPWRERRHGLRQSHRARALDEVSEESQQGRLLLRLVEDDLRELLFRRAIDGVYAFCDLGEELRVEGEQPLVLQIRWSGPERLEVGENVQLSQIPLVRGQAAGREVPRLPRVDGRSRGSDARRDREVDAPERVPVID